MKADREDRVPDDDFDFFVGVAILGLLLLAFLTVVLAFVAFLVVFG